MSLKMIIAGKCPGSLVVRTWAFFTAEGLGSIPRRRTEFLGTVLQPPHPPIAPDLKKERERYK